MLNTRVISGCINVRYVFRCFPTDIHSINAVSRIAGMNALLAKMCNTRTSLVDVLRYASLTSSRTRRSAPPFENATRLSSSRACATRRSSVERSNGGHVMCCAGGVQVLPRELADALHGARDGHGRAVLPKRGWGSRRGRPFAGVESLVRVHRRKNVMSRMNIKHIEEPRDAIVVRLLRAAFLGWSVSCARAEPCTRSAHAADICLAQR